MTTKLPGLSASSISIAVLAMFTILEPVHAQQFDPSWRIHVEYAVVDPSGDVAAEDADGIGVQVGFDNAVGASVRGEYQFSKLLGFELGALGASSVELRSGVFSDSIGTVISVRSFAPVTLGLNFHLSPKSSVDFYAGQFVALVNYGNVVVQAGIGDATSGEPIERDWSWGAIVGLDFPIGKRGWSIQTSLRYLDTRMKGARDDSSLDSDFDPVVFSLGFGYRF